MRCSWNTLAYGIVDIIIWMLLRYRVRKRSKTVKSGTRVSLLVDYLSICNNCGFVGMLGILGRGGSSIHEKCFLTPRTTYAGKCIGVSNVLDPGTANFLQQITWYRLCRFFVVILPAFLRVSWSYHLVFSITKFRRVWDLVLFSFASVFSVTAYTCRVLPTALFC